MTAAALTLPSDLAEMVQRRAAAVAQLTDTGGFVARLVPYERPTQLWDGLSEVFTRGAFAAAVKDPGRVKVMDQGHGRDVIGRATQLDDRADGIWGVFEFAKSQTAQDVRELLAGGYLDEVSIEFQQLPKHRTVSETAEGMLVRHDQARLLGIAPVAHGQYGRGAKVTSARSEADARLDRARRAAVDMLRALNH